MIDLQEAVPADAFKHFHAVSPSEPIIRIEKAVARSPQCVFHCWTVPEFVELICAVDRLEVSAEADLVPGGAFSIVSKRGGVLDHSICGVYTALEHARFIASAWNYRSAGKSWSSTLRLEFMESTDKTVMRITQSGIADPEQRRLQAEWWEDRLARMCSFLGNSARL